MFIHLLILTISTVISIFFIFLIISLKRLSSYLKVSHSSITISLVLIEFFILMYIQKTKNLFVWSIIICMIIVWITYYVGLKINIIGVTGRMGAGKSTLLKQLVNKNIPVIDLDKEIHELLDTNSKIKEFVIKHFSNYHVIQENGKINREILAEVIFQKNKALKQKYLSLIYFYLALKLFNKILNIYFWQNRKFCVIEGSMILNNKFFSLIIFPIICINAPEEVLYKRIKKRNPELSIEDINSRMKYQMSNEEMRLKSDGYISNEYRSSLLLDKFLTKLYEIG